MKKQRLANWVVTVLLYCVYCRLAVAQSFPTPGPEHTELKKLEGTWDVVLTMPGNLKAKGTMTCKMECGGMWLVADTVTNFRGFVVRSKRLEGYDAVKQKYVSVQFDSTSTAPVLLEGTYDKTTKTLTQFGEARDFDGSPEKIKSVLTQIDDDHQQVEVFRVYPDGKGVKHLTIEYARDDDSK